MPMNLASIIAGIVALAFLFLLWGGVHLLARKRLGPRKIGCQGPSHDVEGNPVCCQTGEACDRAPAAKSGELPTRQS